MRFGPHLQYFCSCCGNVLKKNTTLVIQNQQLKEECPSCGALLIDTLQNRRRLSQSISGQQQVTTNITHKPTEHLSVESFKQLINKSKTVVVTVLISSLLT
jgi:predicted RNA-binding Zn-ribbon protein involved in translation (DUF1610 family)